MILGLLIQEKNILLETSMFTYIRGNICQQIQHKTNIATLSNDIPYHISQIGDQVFGLSEQ